MTGAVSAVLAWIGAITVGLVAFAVIGAFLAPGVADEHRRTDANARRRANRQRAHAEAVRAYRSQRAHPSTRPLTVAEFDELWVDRGEAWEGRR